MYHSINMHENRCIPCTMLKGLVMCFGLSDTILIRVLGSLGTILSAILLFLLRYNRCVLYSRVMDL